MIKKYFLLITCLFFLNSVASDAVPTTEPMVWQVDSPTSAERVLRPYVEGINSLYKCHLGKKATLLHKAINYKKSHAVKWLLENGADATIRDTDGRTALEAAISARAFCAKFFDKPFHIQYDKGEKEGLYYSNQINILDEIIRDLKNDEIRKAGAAVKARNNLSQNQTRAIYQINQNNKKAE